MTPTEQPTGSATYVGVDGIPGGWIAMVWRPDIFSVNPHVVAQLSELIEAYPEATIAVDMPIGLSATGTRSCDIAARKFLGAPRASSVFPPPIPAALAGQTYLEAAQISREQHPLQKSIPKQTFAMFPKMREVRATVTSDLQGRAFEMHPEVCFAALAKQPIRAGKKLLAGYDERRRLLEREFGMTLPERDRMRTWVTLHRLDDRALRGPAPDDVLDAMVGAWTARRFAEGRAERFPEVEERDELGLRMEMVY